MDITNKFKITKISTDHKIKCTLVQLNNHKLLFNCGSLNNLDLPYSMPKADMLFISHSEIHFSGGLITFLSNEQNKDLQTFSTIPVKHLSKLFVHEIDSSTNFFYKKEVCNSKDLDLLDNIRTIKYHEPIEVNNIRITAYNSGHSIGGTVWRLQLGPDNLYVGYSMNFINENHINGFLPTIKPHSIFLTDSCYMKQSNISMKERDTNLKNIINKFKGKKIIIPSNYVRLIELLFILNDLDMENLRINVIGNYTKVFEEYMPLFLEYSGSIAFNLLTSHRENPFVCPNVKYTNKIDDEANILIPVDPEFFKILLRKYNNKENLVLMESEKTNFKETLEKYFNTKDVINIFDIKYPEVEIKKEKEILKEESSKTEEDIVQEEEFHEIIYSKPIDEKTEQFFKKPRALPINKVTFNKRSIQNDNFESDISELQNIVEEIELSAEEHSISFNQSFKKLDFQGISSINEFYKNMHSKKLVKLIFEVDNLNETNFLKNLFKKQNIETICNGNPLEFTSPYSFSKVTLNNDVFSNMRLKQYGCLELGSIICNNSEGLNFKPNLTMKVLANLNPISIQKKLKEKEINSKITNNAILIEDNMELTINGDNLNISCKTYNELVLQVKQVLKEFIVYL